jgi:hypothetical protein
VRRTAARTRRKVVTALVAALHLAGAAAAFAEGTILVTVHDPTSGAVAGAEGRVLTGAQAMVATAVSAQDGTFRLTGIPAGRYVLAVHAPGFAITRVPLDVGVSGEQAVTVILEIAALRQDVTVTANAGRVEGVDRSPQAGPRRLSHAALHRRQHAPVG